MPAAVAQTSPRFAFTNFRALEKADFLFIEGARMQHLQRCSGEGNYLTCDSVTHSHTCLQASTHGAAAAVAADSTPLRERKRKRASYF